MRPINRDELHEVTAGNNKPEMPLHQSDKQRPVMKLIVLFVVLTALASAQTRVFLEAGAGYKIVPGVDHPVARSDSAGHNQFMELAKTFLERCSEVTPTINKDKADFVVTMNWAPATRSPSEKCRS
jgi:hypothetical protein